MKKKFTQTNIKQTSVAFLSLVFFSLAPGLQAQLNVAGEVELCASEAESAAVQQYYADTPDAPTTRAGRKLQLPEVKIMSGLRSNKSYGVKVTQEQIQEIWSSIEGWGDRTMVWVVFTVGGNHILNFPSVIPVRQGDQGNGWLNINAANVVGSGESGETLQGHIALDTTHSVWAVDLPGTEEGRYTRTISFYLPDGNLAFGVFASLGPKKFDPAAVAGFKRTQALIKTMPPACP